MILIKVGSRRFSEWMSEFLGEKKGRSIFEVVVSDYS